MKKVMCCLIVLLLVFSMAFSSVAEAKKVEDITAHDVGMFAYKTVRLVLKVLALPFYWMEKVAE